MAQLACRPEVSIAEPHTPAPPGRAMSAKEREAFERDGYLIVPGVLDTDEVARCRTAIMRHYAEASDAGALDRNGALHRLSAVSHCPDLAFLLDHPAVFGFIWSLLGWNIHVYHSHVDVHPYVGGQQPFHWEWHQDGGRQNRELETDPRPRLSVKLAYWLSDLSGTGRGNLTVIPGSHRTNWLPGPPRRDVVWPQPAGAMQLSVNAGDVLVFDRRLWHARTNNHSQVTRLVAFFGYTYRWVAARDEAAHLPAATWWAGLNPVQRQLLGGAGDGSGDHRWGHDPRTTPLYGALAGHGLLDAGTPALQP